MLAAGVVGPILVGAPDVGGTVVGKLVVGAVSIGGAVVSGDGVVVVVVLGFGLTITSDSGTQPSGLGYELWETGSGIWFQFSKPSASG